MTQGLGNHPDNSTTAIALRPGAPTRGRAGAPAKDLNSQDRTRTMFQVRFHGRQAATCAVRAAARPPRRTDHAGPRPPREPEDDAQGVRPPCNNACPARGAHPAVAVRRRRKADRRSTTGPSWDSAVSISSVERFLCDEALRRGWKAPVDAAPTGQRVLVVGAGPFGLSAAYHLTRLDHSVTIKDAGAAPGGGMRYGILCAAVNAPAASSRWNPSRRSVLVTAQEE